MKLRSRLLAIAATLVVAGGGLVAAQTSVSPTTASWTDSVYMTAEVTAAPSDRPDTHGPLTPGNEDTVIGDVQWQIPEKNVGFCSEIPVTTTSPTPIEWVIIVDLTEPPYAGATVSQLRAAWNNVLTADPQYPDIAYLSGASGFERVVEGTTVNASICLDNPLNPPPADSSWYTVDIAPIDPEDWTATSAQVGVTITGGQDLAEHPFFFGWETRLDLSDAFTAMEDAGGHPVDVRWTPDPASGRNFTAVPVGDADTARIYTLTSGPDLAIKGTQSVTITVHIAGWTSG